MAFPKINPEDFLYSLPEERIADYPLAKRDQSKLLVYDKGEIKDRIFRDISKCLPEDTLLFFNNTRVIPARLHFFRQSGAHVEILLDKAYLPSKDPLILLSQTKECTWKCIIGNKKKWKDNESLELKLEFEDREITFSAHLTDRKENLVRFSWNGDIGFAKLLELAGHIPLPPYIKREDQASDKKDYQTVYAKIEGAVAAPTAGLHFTDAVMHDIRNKDIGMQELTLHVGAGTFMPIKTEDASKHNMHSELMTISKENIEAILNHSGKIIPVGTTAMRSLESLYWFGLKLQTENPDSFEMTKEFPFDGNREIDLKQAMENILNWMLRNNYSEFSGDTSIFILPGYPFKVCDGIITNFHQPGTTLILLIAALLGDDWQKVYNHALKNDYRFLSYGDSSLLLP